MTIKNKLYQLLALTVVTFAPYIALAQDPPAPSDGGGEPTEVPLGDTTSNLIFLTIGLLFAGLVIYKRYSAKKAVA